MLALCGCAAIAGCSSPVYRGEEFDAHTPFRKTFRAPTDEVCEAARRALSAEGYTPADSSGNGEAYRASKEFQKDSKTVVQLRFTISCSANADGSSVLFATAQQSTYRLVSTSKSATVGVPMLSIPLPLGATESISLSGAGIETVSDADLYARYYRSVERQLSELRGGSTAR